MLKKVGKKMKIGPENPVVIKLAADLERASRKSKKTSGKRVFAA